MLSLYDELLYMQIYVETVKLKSKVLVFDYVKCISYLLIDWLIKSSSINWNDKIIDRNTKWILLFQLRVLSSWYMEHSWSLLKNLDQFSFSLNHMGRWKGLTAILSFCNDSLVAQVFSLITFLFSQVNETSISKC